MTLIGALGGLLIIIGGMGPMLGLVGRRAGQPDDETILAVER